MAEEKQRTIVLTGVARGLGYAMCEAFIDRGHTVVGCSRNASAIEELSRRHHGPSRFSVVDVTDETAVSQWAHDVTSSVGPPDLLINNAAMMNDPAKLWEIPSADFRRLIEANVIGVFHVCKHFLPAMVQRKQGVIVNFTSGWGRSTAPEVAPYCASKYAVEGLTLALAMELPKGMAAVPLNPGVINTDMLRQCFSSDADHYPSPQKWAVQAVPFILNLSAADNGKPLSVPQ